jgi:hypothetical protein
VTQSPLSLLLNRAEPFFASLREHTGDTLAYIYSLTAEGTTHGFERGYDALLGDPFGVDIVTNNLSVSVALADAPEAGTCLLTLLGLAGLIAWRWREQMRNRPV